MAIDWEALMVQQECQRLKAEPTVKMDHVTAIWALGGYLLFDGLSGALAGAVLQQLGRAWLLPKLQAFCEES